MPVVPVVKGPLDDLYQNPVNCMDCVLNVCINKTQNTIFCPMRCGRIDVHATHEEQIRTIPYDNDIGTKCRCTDWRSCTKV